MTRSTFIAAAILIALFLGLALLTEHLSAKPAFRASVAPTWEEPTSLNGVKP